MNEKKRLHARTQKRVGGGGTDQLHNVPGPRTLRGSLETILAGAELLDTTGTLQARAWLPMNDNVEGIHHSR